MGLWNVDMQRLRSISPEINRIVLLAMLSNVRLTTLKHVWTASPVFLPTK